MIWSEPKYFRNYKLAEERLIQKMKKSICNLLEVIFKSFRENAKKIVFVSYFKGSINWDKEDLYDYYYEKKSREIVFLLKRGC